MKARALSRAERGEKGVDAVRAWCSASSLVRTRGPNILHFKFVAQARTRLDCDERLEKMHEVNAKHYHWFSQHEGAQPP